MSFFKRNEESPPGDVPAADAVAQARIRARRRLIGATVLLGIGVIGFPLLFETQPRPIPVDIPIEIPKRESAPPLTWPPGRAPTSASAEVAAPDRPLPGATAAATASATARGQGATNAPAPSSAPSPAPSPAPAIVTERADDQGREVTAPTPSARAASAAAARTAAQPSSATTARAPAPSASVAARAAPSDAQRAQALLEGRTASPKPDADAAGQRLVVQVGAYTDADKLREARQKVEKLGMKTYTQVVEADGAKRTRVRVGPFASREEADKAAARLKAAGLPVAVLTL